PPNKTFISGVGEHATQGTLLTLMCTASGARPPAKIEWFNGTDKMDTDQYNVHQREVELGDTTFETTSNLTFEATKYENGRKFHCEASNEVTMETKDHPMHAERILEICIKSMNKIVAKNSNFPIRRPKKKNRDHSDLNIYITINNKECTLIQYTKSPLSITDPPIVRVEPPNVTAVEGSKLLLKCEYESNPSSLNSVMWYRDGKRVAVNDTSHYQGGTTEQHSLIILDARGEDMGKLYLRADQRGRKSRVTPLVPVTISRLELQAALVAARLASTLCEAHRNKPTRRFFWSDSKNVLGWLRSDAKSFTPFVAHRVADIHQLTSIKEWRWVPTILNVADDATRADVVVPLDGSRWLVGPEFLKSHPNDWPLDPHYNNISTDELKPSVRIQLCTYLINVNSIIILKPLSANPSRFSQWLRLLRVTARAHQYIRLLKDRASVGASISHKPAVRISSVAQLTRVPSKNNNTLLHPLTAEDLRLAQRHILLQSQEDSFQEELAALCLKESLPRHSKLRKFDIVLNSDGLMTLSGRIGAVTESFASTNFPVLLDGSHRAVRLLIDYYHRRLAHGNHETVVNELRQQFWILKLRSSVRSVAQACQFCRIKKAAPLNPPVGNLPAARLAFHQRPFSFTGLDYFGPVQVTVGRRQEKRYVALYTCLTTRAVHLEVVHDLSTDAALMALRRFTAKRGTPQQIWSDNGTAFVGAAKF
ncbi:hypothetical protein ACJJTC_016664, partial [Scirpophaga incertulas]